LLTSSKVPLQSEKDLVSVFKGVLISAYLPTLSAATLAKTAAQNRAALVLEDIEGGGGPPSWESI
jgi:hypothetical protein